MMDVDAVRPRRSRRAAIAFVGAVAILAQIPSLKAEYAGPVHSDDEIKRLTEYRGPVATPNVLAAWTQDFLGERANRAIAVSDKGSYGTGFGFTKLDDATETALKNCRTRGERENLGTDCKLYAVNTKIVYPGAEYALPPLDIKICDFTFRNEYVFYGPRRAKGIIVWGHGFGKKCQTQNRASPWPFVNRFNLAGWDILQFDRDPCYDDDINWAIGKLTQSVPMLRDAGYRTIVLGGQSRGAWQSLEAVRRGKITNLVSGVIAVSPARNGENTAALQKQPDEWRQLIDGFDAGPIRICVLFFDKDSFNPAAAYQTQYAREGLSAKKIDNVLIYESDPAILKEASGQNGHYGAGSAKFTAKYSPCLIRFIETGERAESCRPNQ